MAKKSKAKPKLKPKNKSAAKPKVKPAIKRHLKPRAKPRIKAMAKPKVKPSAKAKVMTKTKQVTKSKPVMKAMSLISRATVKELPVSASRTPTKSALRHLGGPVHGGRTPAPIVKRIVNQMVERRRPIKRPTRVNQYNFMKAPGLEHAFEVGGGVEVFCDHEKNKERIRGWVKGIVVQVDNKMVAVQFRSNVYLTDGWMVPDRILWFPLNSEHMRLIPGKKPITKDLIPDY